MHHIKEYLTKIVEDGDKMEMHELSKMLDEVICKMREYDYDLFCKYKMKLYEMANGKVLTLEMAEEWVKNMKPMGHYTKEETDKMIRERNLSVNDIDFYVAVNMMCSDYGKIFGDDINKYIEMAMAFLNDEDSKPDKIYLYWKDIVQKD